MFTILKSMHRGRSWWSSSLSSDKLLGRSRSTIQVRLFSRRYAHQINIDFRETAPTSIASVLSFGSAIAGFGLGWSSLAADYTVNMPEDASSVKIFIYAYLGLNVPLILIETLGQCSFFAASIPPTF